MEKKNLLQKINYIFDRKQKMMFVVLGVMIFIGGVLETLGVGTMIPVVTVLLQPDKLQSAIDEIDALGRILSFLNVRDISRLTSFLLTLLMAVFIIKNAYLLFQTYVQSSFITHNRNKMIARVMAEFLNRPYEDYLGADIPTVFRLTDSDIPQTFSLITNMLSLASEAVVSLFIFIFLLFQNVKMTLFIIAVFGVMTIFITRIFKPRLNKIGAKNQKIQSRIAKWRIQAIYGLKDVKVLNREEFFVRNYYETGEKGADVARTYSVMNNTPRLLIETVFMVSVLTFVLIFLKGGGDVTTMVTTIATFAVAAIRVLPSVNRINTYMTEIAYMQPSLDYVYENLKEGMKNDEKLAIRRANSQKEKLTL
ncbi:MAG: ABC transporter ATP-binding protein, partial [Lachnospiraceae bacterium]|nr:ABC transporter ATP-binding protein [Lachnospiraceae bacterium]